MVGFTYMVDSLLSPAPIKLRRNVATPSQAHPICSLISLTLWRQPPCPSAAKRHVPYQSLINDMLMNEMKKVG
jgi:hypothetical protein